MPLVIWFGSRYGRHVDVGREQVLDDVLLVEVLVDEQHVIGKVELLDQGLQPVAVLLAARLEQLRVRLARDQVERLGVACGHGGHRLDRVLQPLARTDEAERRDDRAPVQAELGLQAATPLRLDVGHPVGDHERPFLDAVVAVQDVDRGLGHHDEPVRGLGDGTHRLADRRGGIGQHRVHVHQRRLLQLLEEGSEVVLVHALDPVVADEAAALPQAVEAEFVLDADDLGVGSIDLACGGPVGKRAALLDPPADLAAVGAHGVALVDRGDPALGVRVGLAHGADQVGGERGDAASARRIGGDERDPHDFLAYLGRASSRNGRMALSAPRLRDVVYLRDGAGDV